MKPRVLRTAEDLAAAGLIPPERVADIAGTEARYAVSITPTMQALIEAPDDPIGLQFIPDPAELAIAPYEHADPIGDDALSPIKGIVHRYPDRALLKPILACPVYCRFCFRREHVGPDGGLLSDAELRAAYAWLAERPAIQEVILTGGDPLMLSPRRLGEIVAALSSIPHIQTIRVHSRVPVADPARVTTALAAALRTDRAMWVVIHANHAREFTPEARAAIRMVQAEAIPVLGQSVLLRGVNDSAEALEALFRAMLRARVKPVLPAPARSRARHVALSRADRGGPAHFACAAGAGDGTRVADLRDGHSGRIRESARRAGLSRRGERARSMGRRASARIACSTATRFTGRIRIVVGTTVFHQYCGSPPGIR